MTKNQYISVLQQHLNDIPAHEQEEFINDYKEHFVLGIEEGRSEEEIADRLGPPEKTAKEIRAQYQLTAAEQKPTYKSVSKAVFAAVSLGLFNLIFILGPLLALISIPIALLITAGTLVISPLLLLIQEGIGQSYWNQGFLMIGYVGVGLLLGIGTMKLIQWMYSLILRYVKFNLRMVRSESK
ncbi:HAAS domain-containing protein [Geomicrobium sp. JCM 19039]|uniref:HAAS signaling domain-containing protein n=1 Tax=Geomicrobium sp. JCM 19039 TaxID=1460636 RepID=UPI00045F3DFC|nr:DUF1700 domain-containing protein [Geomicrobium sp. JCM 19039]GAK13294.1 hypothetical protein JCM19039_3132 [Geomicrobium sp. JCM 19039]